MNSNFQFLFAGITGVIGGLLAIYSFYLILKDYFNINKKR